MGKALELVHRFYGVFDSEGIDKLGTIFDDLFTESLEVTNPFGTFHGREILQVWSALATAFPDVRHAVRATVEAGDVVCVEGDFVGTQTGPLRMPDGAEAPPSGRQLSLPYAHAAGVDGDRFAWFRVYFDTGTFARQLGLVPEPAEAMA